jgi:hypothetical protein
MVFSRRNVHRHCVDRPWALFQLLGHLATGREHCNDHRDFSNGMIDIEKLSDEELQALSKKFEAIRAESQARLRDS